MIAMLPMNTGFAARRARDEADSRGMGPALIGSWIGGTVLAALALWAGFGWLAALAAYSFGGSVVLMLLAVLPALELRPQAAVLRPAFVRARRSRG